MMLRIPHIYKVRGESMCPTLYPGDRLLVDPRAYTGTGPERGDIAVIQGRTEIADRHLKRVVGLPGELVRLTKGLLLIDGDHLVEPYLVGLPATLGLADQRWSLGEDEYFALGDNRAHSTDSREYGPVRRELVLGRAWFRVWPISRLGSLTARA